MKFDVDGFNYEVNVESWRWGDEAFYPVVSNMMPLKNWCISVHPNNLAEY